MKIRLILSILIFAWCGMGIILNASESDKEIHVRVAAYNVEFGKNASPEEIGRMFKPYNFDIIGFNEVPDGLDRSRGKGSGHGAHLCGQNFIRQS